MLRILLFILLFSSTSINAQKGFKKKFLGKYEGQIAAYKINSGSQFIDVSSTNVSLIIRKENITFSIGKNEMTGPYIWSKKDKKTILIEFSRPIDETKEIFVLTKKTKEIIRQGIYPQPTTTLRKVKKRGINKNLR